jgi:2-oxoisovalerate dehydrogenase E2 component (dihydrolipoyl transacylase)
MVMVHRGAHNIGIAMDTPKGLVVPNIKAVQASRARPHLRAPG